MRTLKLRNDWSASFQVIKVVKHFWNIFITLNLWNINNLIHYVLKKASRTWLKRLNTIWTALASRMAHQPLRINCENTVLKVLAKAISREKHGDMHLFSNYLLVFPQKHIYKARRRLWLAAVRCLAELEDWIMSTSSSSQLHAVDSCILSKSSYSDKILSTSTWKFLQILTFIEKGGLFLNMLYISIFLLNLHGIFS